tara:strand:+ start:1842 stop:1970 length:129 start_codon:yes stop_codon:yes gene_type:complete
MTVMTKGERSIEVHDADSIEKYEQLGWQVQVDSDGDEGEGDE